MRAPVAVGAPRKGRSSCAAVALREPAGCPGVLRLTVLVGRIEGLRVQSLAVDCNELARAMMDFQFSSLESCHVPIKHGVPVPGRVGVAPKGVSDRRIHRRVLFCLEFDAGENSATVARAKRGGDCEKGDYDAAVVIRLRDPRAMVREVRILRGVESEKPRSRRGVSISNLCAKSRLSHALDPKRFLAVGERRRAEFGCVMELFGACGSISVKRDLQTVLVKGACEYTDVLEDLQALSGGDGAGICLNVHMLVLSACLGVTIDVTMGSLVERTIAFRYKGLLYVRGRHEECSNHVELSSVFNAVALEILERCLGADNVPRAAYGGPCGVILHISLSRFGEVLFRVSFAGSFAYNARTDTWVRAVCACYVAFFTAVFEGAALPPAALLPAACAAAGNPRVRCREWAL